jgi:hypothetical protein
MESQNIFLIIWCVIMPVIFYLLYIRGSKVLLLFPNLETVKIRYKERRVSGRSISNSNIFNGGAKSVLHVYITDDELWVQSHWVNASAPKQAEMIHKIKLTEIENAVLEPKNRVIIRYKTTGGTQISFWLKLNKPEAFLTLLQQQMIHYNHNSNFVITNLK